MIERCFETETTRSTALYSTCETYRYALTRVWDETAPKVLFIMLNPSKATERQNDPTIERCERRARALGYGGFRAVNIFALRETDPLKMRRHKAPAGPENDHVVLEGCDWADDIIAAWGAHGAHLQRGDAMRDVLKSSGRDLLCFGVTKAGHPRHPLYISYVTQPQTWSV